MIYLSAGSRCARRAHRSISSLVTKPASRSSSSRWTLRSGQTRSARRSHVTIETILAWRALGAGQAVLAISAGNAGAAILAWVTGRSPEARHTWCPRIAISARQSISPRRPRGSRRPETLSRLAKPLLDGLAVALVTSVDGGVVHDPVPTLDTDHGTPQHGGSVARGRSDLLTMVGAVMCPVMVNLVTKQIAKIDGGSSGPLVSLDTAPKPILCRLELSMS